MESDAHKIKPEKNIDFIVVEELNGKRTFIHHVKMPDLYGGEFYRHNKSMLGFRHRSLKRFGDHLDKQGSFFPAPARHFDVRMYDAYYEELSLLKTIGLTELDLPIVVHESPFAFYKYIQFDYKKNKYL